MTPAAILAVIALYICFLSLVVLIFFVDRLTNLVLTINKGYQSLPLLALSFPLYFIFSSLLSYFVTCHRSISILVPDIFYGRRRAYHHGYGFRFV